ncbi:hypothetical protein D3C72_1917040 [compost metagenome]
MGDQGRAHLAKWRTEHPVMDVQWRVLGSGSLPQIMGDAAAVGLDLCDHLGQRDQRASPPVRQVRHIDLDGGEGDVRSETSRVLRDCFRKLDRSTVRVSEQGHEYIAQHLALRSSASRRMPTHRGLAVRLSLIKTCFAGDVFDLAQVATIGSRARGTKRVRAGR